MKKQVRDGEIHRYYKRKNGACIVVTICCDCGLTHVQEFIPKKRYVRVRVWRDDKRTEHERRQRMNR